MNRAGSGLHDPAILPEVLRRWKESVDSGTDFRHGVSAARRFGQYRWFLTRVTPVTDMHGKVVRWFGTNTDIHEAREIREQLQRANANLGAIRVFRLSRSSRTASQCDDLQPIAWQKISRVLDEQGAEFLGYITEGATRMETLVSDLLAYAESGKPSDVRSRTLMPKLF